MERKRKNIYDSDGDISFDAEYLNGKKWYAKRYEENAKYEIKEGKGFIKELDKNGKIKFEGQYLNGEKNGDGKEWDSKRGFLKFKGKYKNGLRSGYGYEFYYNNCLFEGEYLYGKRYGMGKDYSGDEDNSIVFEGIYLIGKKWDGKCYDKSKNAIYEINKGKGTVKQYRTIFCLKFEGEFLKGEKTGKIAEFDKAVLFEGELYKDKRIGKGKEYYMPFLVGMKKLIFEGEYNDNKKKGKQYNYDDDLLFEGEYLYNKKRKGKIYLNKRLEFEGEFLFDKKWSGKGYDINGNVIYELINGNGKVKEFDFNEYSDEKLIFEGEYLNGLKHGHAIEYNRKGFKIFEGEYLNGENAPC